MMALLVGADPARSVHWLWPELKEIIWGVPASLIIFGLLYKFAGPPIKKFFSDRTARIQSELDESAAAEEAARAEAAEIRQAAGDIESERARLLAEADEQAAAMLADGRQRLEDEIAEMRQLAEADIAAMSGRAGDELHVEVARHARAAVDHYLARGLDDGAQQDLIESFISRVGAQS